MVTALVTELQAEPTLTAVVFDGPPVTSDPLPDVVCIGLDLDNDAGNAGRIEQEWHEMGGTPPRDESGWIRCTAVAQRGDVDVPGCRSAAFGLLETIETVIRGNYDLDVGQLLYAQVRDADVRQGVSKDGAYCEIAFRVYYRALI